MVLFAIITLGICAPARPPPTKSTRAHANAVHRARAAPPILARTHLHLTRSRPQLRACPAERAPERRREQGGAGPRHGGVHSGHALLELRAHPRGPGALGRFLAHGWRPRQQAPAGPSGDVAARTQSVLLPRRSTDLGSCPQVEVSHPEVVP
jgi:hypothetical protein